MRLIRDSWFPTKVEIPSEGCELPVLIKSLDYSEGTWLKAKYIEAVRKGTVEERVALLVPLMAEAFQRFAKIDFERILGKELNISRDGVDVKIETLDQLLLFYGGESAMVDAIFSAILTQSTLSEREKKRSRRPSGSKPSSGEPSPGAPGEKPAPTATSAGNGASVEIADATAPETNPSGSTEPETKTEDPPSSSMNARSVH